jgi:hypothetical protein
MTKPKKATHFYFDKQEIQAEMLSYWNKVQEAKLNGTTKPRVPEKVGKSILDTANRIASRPEFTNYPFKLEMISDGVENCLTYIDNYNPVEYNNPFGYFSKIIWFAFLRRIKKEKKELYMRHKILEREYTFHTLVEQQIGERSIDPSYVDIDSEMRSDFVKTFEEKLEKEKQKVKEKRRQKLEEKTVDI